MTVLHAVDAVIVQEHMGSVCHTGFSWLHSKTTGLNLTDLFDVAAELIDNFLPLLNGVQSSYTINHQLKLQARGTTVPAWDYALTGYGLVDVPAANVMPPEFNYWLRMYPEETQESITGDVDTAHPIKAGGAFIVGASDLYLTNAQFGVPAGDPQDAWDALEVYLVSSHAVGSYQIKGAILGEEIVSGTGWRIAETFAAKVKRITRLRSRMVS